MPFFVATILAFEAVAMTSRPLSTDYLLPLRRMETISKRMNTRARI